MWISPTRRPNAGWCWGSNTPKVCQHRYTVLIFLETSWIPHFNRASMGNARVPSIAHDSQPCSVWPVRTCGKL